MIYTNMYHTAQSIITNIHAHPFNLELAQGSLPQEKFIFYLIQDSLYLAEFSRALAITAGRLHQPVYRHHLIKFALGAVESEQLLHQHYLNHFCSQDDLNVTKRVSPACFMYTNYVLNTVSLASVEEAMACVLPCFIVYHEVGKKMLAYQCDAHPYHDWIALYASDAFESSTQVMIEIINAIGHVASPALQQKMMDAFVRSVQLEWYFWQGAYHQEMWVV